MRTGGREQGLSMIEVLVTVVILAAGLLGLMGLQSRVQVMETESYQRAQALVLLEDMANRLMVNRKAAAAYVTGSEEPLGTGFDCRVTSTSTLQQKDACEWSALLQGSAEMSGTNKIGAVIGGRGCVEELGNNEYLLTVAWQGMAPSSAPPAEQSCGRTLYDGGANSSCTNDRCRRTVTTVVRIGSLS